VSDQPAIRLEGITKTFGDVVANDAVDLTVRPGTIHALLGENGSGKTTLMNVLYGLYDPDAGTVVVDGEPHEFDSPQDAMSAGIGMIHQHFQLVEPMTVLQNVVLGHEPTDGAFVDEAAAADEIADICDRYGFDVDDHLREPIADLDLGTRQRVEIVKSLYRGAEVLILDEPTAVLTPQEVDGLMALMRDLQAAGRSLIFISHKLEEVRRIADEITVLRDGRAVDTVDADATTEAELARLMVGREVLFDRPDRETTVGDPILEVDDLVVTGDRGLEQVSGVDVTLREREILGIAGVQGNGQTELVESLTGLRSVDAGSVRLHDADVTDASRRERIERGIAYVPGDRQREGLVQRYDLVRNALLGNQTVEPYATGTGGWIDWDAVADHADAVVEEFDVQPPTTETTAGSLSGGNQQKFIVGREIGHDPAVLVADHPTRGVDIGSIEFIHSRLIELRDAGLGIVVVSSKLDEIQTLADRIVVMYEGEFIATVDPDETTEAELGLLMAGHRPDSRGDRDVSAGDEETATLESATDPESATSAGADPDADANPDPEGTR